MTESDVNEVIAIFHSCEEGKKKLEASKILLFRFIVSLIFTVPLLIITMGHMLGMPLPHIIDSMMNPLNFAISPRITNTNNKQVK